MNMQNIIKVINDRLSHLNSEKSYWEDQLKSAQHYITDFEIRITEIENIINAIREQMNVNKYVFIAIHQNKIEAIKQYRTDFGVVLKEAKDIVEKLIADHETKTAAPNPPTLGDILGEALKSKKQYGYR
jgi:hypothetical protein